MADLVHLSNSASSEEIIDILNKDAGVIIDNLLHSDDISRINQDLKPYLKNDVFGRDEFTGFKTKRVGALIARSEACRELALNSLINEVSEKYLSPYCDGYQLHFTSAVSIGPGESKQILHRDRGIWGGYLPRKVEPLMSTIWAVTDFTKENGATQIVPGSHLWEKDRTPNDDEIAYAEMKAGSVLLYTGTVLHGGGENTSKNDNTERLSGVVMQSDDKSALCKKWEKAFGIKADEDLQINLSDSRFKFIDNLDQRGEGINAFELSVKNKEVVYE